MLDRDKKTTGYYSEIRVCFAWKNSFKDFLKDMGRRHEGMSLDRIDNTKGYYKDNCRWAPQQLQILNTRVFRNNTSGFKGVYYHKNQNKWLSSLVVNGFNVHIGSFQDKEDAIATRYLLEQIYKAFLMAKVAQENDEGLA
jgi:hypothetical protein